MYASICDQFLFVKSNKTAGTSIEIALTICLANREQQFFTPISFEDELLRMHLSGISFSTKMQSLLAPNRLNTLSETKAALKTSKLINKKKLASLLRKSQTNFKALQKMHTINANAFTSSTGYFNHIPYSKCVSNDTSLGEFWSCTFARHPYKRFLSFLAWRSRNLQGAGNWTIEDWNNFADKHIDFFCERNLNYYSKDILNNKSVNEVLTVERLQDSTNIMCENLDLPPDSIFMAMPKTKTKSSNSIKNISPDDIINKKIKDKILKSEESLFKGLGYQDSLDNFSPERVSISMQT